MGENLLAAGVRIAVCQKAHQAKPKSEAMGDWHRVSAPVEEEWWWRRTSTTSKMIVTMGEND